MARRLCSTLNALSVLDGVVQGIGRCLLECERVENFGRALAVAIQLLLTDRRVL